MIIYKPYAIDPIWCSILWHQMLQSNNCSNRNSRHSISLFDNPDESVNTISPTMRIFVLCWNHHCIFLHLRTSYPLLSLPAAFSEGRYRFSAGQAFLIMQDLIQRSPAKVWYSKRRNSAFEGVIEVTFGILDPDVLSFRHDPLVGISIFYLAIKSQTLNRCCTVKWWMVVRQPILKFNEYTAKEYILIVSEYQSSNFVFPVLLNLCTE